MTISNNFATCLLLCSCDQNLSKNVIKFERKQKGGFVKGWFWPMCPRSVFLYRRSVFCNLVPVFRVRHSCFLCPRSGFGCPRTSAETTLLESCLLRTLGKCYNVFLQVCDNSAVPKRGFIRNVRLFIILFLRNFWRVCSQFWLSVRYKFKRKSISFFFAG